MKVKTEVHGSGQIIKRLWIEVAEEATRELLSSEKMQNPHTC